MKWVDARVSVVCSLLCLLLLLMLDGCDSTTAPARVCAQPEVICDTMDLVNLDSIAVLSIPMMDEEYYVMYSNETAFHSSGYTVVLNARTNDVVFKENVGYYDLKSGWMLYREKGEISEYCLSSGEIRNIVSGYEMPSYSMDTSKIIIRRFGETFIYDRHSGVVRKVADTRNCKEYMPGLYITYGNGFNIINDSANTVKKLDVAGLPSKHATLGVDDWHIDQERRRIIVHFHTINGELDDNGLFEIDIENLTATRIIGRTDWSYTPRYSYGSRLLYSRSCITKHEGYIVEYDRECSQERVVLVAKMLPNGDVVYSLK